MLKTAAALGKQGAKTLLAWLPILLVMVLFGSDYQHTTFRLSDFLRDVAVVICSLLIYRHILWLFQPSPFLADSLRFDLNQILRGSLFGLALAAPLVLLQWSGWFNTQLPATTQYNFADTVLRAFSISLVAGVTEELMCRGILLHALEKVLGSWWAVWLQALLFGALHYARPDVLLVDLIPLACMGVMFGAIYVLTRSLWYTIAMHFFYDWVMLSYPGAIESMLKPGIDYVIGEYIVVAFFSVGVLWISIKLMSRAQLRGHVLPPHWRREPESLPSADAVNEST
jgi:membrane protease YdiL (CAAX protease family)